MKKILARYKVKKGMVEANEELIKRVYKELNYTKPEAFSYATYKLDDGLTFIHIALNKSDGKSPLSDLAAFKKFQESIEERCEEPPVVSHLEVIGSFAMSEHGNKITSKQE